VKKASAVARSWHAHLENEQVAATHDVFHLKVLKKYMLDNNKSSLLVTDINNLLYEAGEEDTVLEVPSDSEIQISQFKKRKVEDMGGNIEISRQKKKQKEENSAGPSTGPSLNHSFTPESLSSDGFEPDSASDYIPSL